MPARWRREYEDGGYCLDPANIGGPAFYEDWPGSDGDAAGQAAARRGLVAELRRAAAIARDDDKRLIVEALERLEADPALM